MHFLRVGVSIAPDYEHALNEWYYTHIPRLLTVAGYESAARYLSLSGEPKYLALYELGDASDLPGILGEDPSLRHPLTLSEWDTWDKRLAPHMDYNEISVYEGAIDNNGGPMWSEGLLEIRGSEDDASEQVVEAGLQLLSDQSGLVGKGHLLPCRDPIVQWLNASGRLTTIVQFESAEAAAAAIQNVAFREATANHAKRLKVEPPTLAVFRLVALHRSWEKIGAE